VSRFNRKLLRHLPFGAVFDMDVFLYLLLDRGKAGATTAAGALADKCANAPRKQQSLG
jgi:hypothetical protein